MKKIATQGNGSLTKTSVSISEKSSKPKRRQVLANRGEPLTQRVILRLTQSDHRALLTHLDRMKSRYPRMTLSDLIRDHYFSRGAFANESRKRTEVTTEESLVEFARGEGTEENHPLYDLLYLLAATRRSLKGYLNNHNQIARKVNAIQDARKLLAELQNHERLVGPVAGVITKLDNLLQKLEEMLG